MNFKIYPKLNIFLKIVGYKGGYHQLQSRFVVAYGDIYDEMEISSHSHFVLKGNFDCDMQDNLIYKSKCVIKDFLRQNGKDTKGLESIKIEVQKYIPKGAGLGGGSADAGAFIRAINTFLNLGLEYNTLMDLAKDVGSDVSFFVSGADSANVCGKGEIVEHFAESPLEYEIHTQPLFCDTKLVFAHYADSIKRGRRTYSESKHEWFALTSDTLLGFSKTREYMNDLFESATSVYPSIKDISYELGDGWYFSGSGSSFFRLKV